MNFCHFWFLHEHESFIAIKEGSNGEELFLDVFEGFQEALGGKNRG